MGTFADMTEHLEPTDEPVEPVAQPGDRTHRRTGLRRAGWAMLVVGILVIGSGGWIGVTGYQARSELLEVRAGLSQLREEISARDFVAAQKTAQQVAGHATKAHDLTTGPAWWTGAHVPYLGDPLVTVRGIAQAADELANQVLPPLIAVGRDVDPKNLQSAPDRINVAALKNLSTRLQPALVRIEQVEAQVAALPTRTWVKTVDDARSELGTALADLTSTARSAGDALRIAPTLLGADSPQRYFVGFLNNAETRGVGGLPGAFAILVVDKGQLIFEHFGTDDEMAGLTANVDFGPDYQSLYAAFLPTTQYLNSTASPNFPYAAQIWASMWESKTGEKITGAIAVDPTALSYLLEQTGPAVLPDGTQVTAQDVVELTQSSAYTLFGDDQTARKAYLLAIATAVENRILTGDGNIAGLAVGGTKAIDERRLVLWSADPAVQKVLATGAIGGTVPVGSMPFAGVVVNNDSASKLDYYLDATLDWKREGCGATRTVTATMTFTNNAPEGLPDYVTGYPKNGDNFVQVDYQATAGAQLKSLSLNGEVGTAQAGAELGHPVFRKVLSLPRGQTVTLVLTLSEPAGRGAPVVHPQPLIRPMKVTVTDATCS